MSCNNSRLPFQWSNGYIITPYQSFQDCFKDIYHAFIILKEELVICAIKRVIPVNHLHKAVIKLGYKGVCIAPGGRLAVKYVKGTRPRAIVAVACQKELEEGIHGVQELKCGNKTEPLIIIIPLVRDGCVDTEVDAEKAVELIASGYSLEWLTA